MPNAMENPTINKLYKANCNMRFTKSACDIKGCLRDSNFLAIEAKILKARIHFNNNLISAGLEICLIFISLPAVVVNQYVKRLLISQ